MRRRSNQTRVEHVVSVYGHGCGSSVEIGVCQVQSQGVVAGEEAAPRTPDGVVAH
jgi:hypothetical protein